MCLQDSYTVFAPLFDAIIEDYHGGYKARMHTSCRNVSADCPLSPPTSTRRTWT